MPSPKLLPATPPTRLDSPTGPVAGPSNAPGKRRERTSPQPSSDEDNGGTPRSEHPPHPYVSGGVPGPAPAYGQAGYGAPTPTTSIRRPERTLSTARPIRTRSITLAEPPLASNNGLPDELDPEGLTSRPSIIDHVVPSLSTAQIAALTNGNGNRRRSLALSQAATLAAGEKTVEQRLQPTLDAAIAERDKAALKAKAHSWALNCAIGAQVVLGALTTGVAAATTGRQTSIATSILGGMSTLAASYLAKARGSGEPEISSIRCRDLEGFIRDCQAFMLDKGFMVGTEYDSIVDRYRRRFEEIMGNGAGGVGDQVQSRQQGQQQTSKEKTTLPV
ncbi:hypothetical protein BD413DRAFT_469016 [Trametes elegans]|nr:hypothetical protein BD413DRAFT_469016 [Trametes elegans]